MSEETLKKLNDIHLLYSMPYKVENMRAEHYAINEYEKLVYSQMKEIERLNKDNGDITKLFAKEREETKRLHSIIKEVRELLNQEWYSVLRKGTITKAKEILDKVEMNDNE